MNDVVTRLNRLGITCDAVPADQLCSAIAALACFPMYMVANVHAWTSDRQFKIPFLDLPGWEAVRESLTLGSEERRLDMNREHRHLLATLLGSAKPSDLVIYDYALETLRVFLASAEPPVAAQIRRAVAHMIVAVAKASGDGLFSRQRVSPEERACIEHIREVLELTSDPAAAEMLAHLDG